MAQSHISKTIKTINSVLKNKSNDLIFKTGVKTSTFPIKASYITKELTDEEYKSNVKKQLIKDEGKANGITKYGIAYFEDKDLNLEKKIINNELVRRFYAWMYEFYWAGKTMAERKHINLIFPELLGMQIETFRENAAKAEEYVKVIKLDNVTTKDEMIYKYLYDSGQITPSHIGLHDKAKSILDNTTFDKDMMEKTVEAQQYGTKRLPYKGIYYKGNTPMGANVNTMAMERKFFYDQK